MKKGLTPLGAFLLLLTAGCGPSALSFNQGVVNANNRLQKAGQDFGTALGPAIQRKTGANDALKKSYDDLVKTLNEVKGEVSALRVPADQSAADFLAAEKKFLDVEQSMIDNEMKQMMDVALNDRLDEGAKKAQLAQLLKSAGDKEKAEMNALQQVQRTFAQNHNITLQ